MLGEHSDLGGVADGDPAVAAAAVGDVERAVDWAAELGSDALLVPFFGRAELRDEADIERAAGALRPLCRRAAERGVALLYEGTLASTRSAASRPPSTRRRSAATSTLRTW